MFILWSLCFVLGCRSGGFNDDETIEKEFLQCHVGQNDKSFTGSNWYYPQASHGVAALALTKKLEVAFSPS